MTCTDAVFVMSNLVLGFDEAVWKSQTSVTHARYDNCVHESGWVFFLSVLFFKFPEILCT